MGGLERPPTPPTFGAPRRSRDGPLILGARSDSGDPSRSVLRRRLHFVVGALVLSVGVVLSFFIGSDFLCFFFTVDLAGGLSTPGLASGCRWCLARCRCWTRPTATRVDAHAAVPATRRARAGGTARARAACGSATRRTAQDRDAQERQRRLHHVRKGRGSVRWPKRRGIMIRF